MSRKAKKAIELDNAVEVANQGGTITVKGPKGELTQKLGANFDIKIEDQKLYVLNNNQDLKETDKDHGLYQSLIANMIQGVKDGYEIRLTLNGVGFRGQKKGESLELGLGFSHPVIVEMPEGVTANMEGQTTIVIAGIDKQRVGQVAANIVSYRDAMKDPYKKKGVNYEGRHIPSKTGKKA